MSLPSLQRKLKKHIIYDTYKPHQPPTSQTQTANKASTSFNHHQDKPRPQPSKIQPLTSATSISSFKLVLLLYVPMAIVKIYTNIQLPSIYLPPPKPTNIPLSFCISSLSCVYTSIPQKTLFLYFTYLHFSLFLHSSILFFFYTAVIVE